MSFKLINFRGEMFATAFSFAVQAVIRLTSSLILTRILRPEAYGVITIVTSVVFIVSMLSDVGIGLYIVRDQHGEDQRYLNTAWTLRLVRAFINGSITFAGAPLLASLYAAPALTVPIRVFSLWFIIDGFESTSFPLALRHRKARIVKYCELVALLLSTAFSILYCYFSRDYWGIVYGALLNRLILVVLSHRFYRDLRPRLQFDRAAAREMFKYTRVMMPSSLLTLGLDQFDKAAFLRLFDLRLLGIYGLAGNIASPVEGLINTVCQTVLYPRCAHDFRTNRDTFALNYYTQNVRLFGAILTVPALLGGAAPLIVRLLYDPRYELAGAVLQAFMVRAALSALASTSQEMLIAAGELHVILLSNVLRVIWVPVASLSGYYLFGFMGFTYGMALSWLPPLVYYLWLQNRKGLLMPRYEVFRVMYVCAVAAAAHFLSSGLLAALAVTHIRLWP